MGKYADALQEGMQPQNWQEALSQGSLASYLWNNGISPAVKAVYGDPVGTAKAVGAGMLEQISPEHMQSVVNSAQGIGTMDGERDMKPAFMDALNIGAIGGPVGAATAPSGSVGMFAGKMAKTANLDKLAQAEKMAASGASRDSIWGETGWFKAPDGKWKWEIDDSGAKVDMKDLADFANTGSTRSNWLLPHPEIEGAYSRAERGYTVTKQADRGGSFSPENGTIGIDQSLAQVTDNGLRRVAPEDIRRTMLHEMQHGVQREEGFARGGSPEMFNQQAEAELARDALVWRRELLRLKEQTPGADIIAIENSAIDAYRKMGAMDWLPSRDARDLARQPNILFAGKHYPETDLRDLEQLVSLYGLDKNTTPAKPMDMYRRLAGETEARAVQARMNMTSEQRASRPPWQDYDVPEDKQIVRFGGNGPSSMAPVADIMTPPAWASKGAGHMKLFKNPDDTELTKILRDPSGGGAIAMLGDGEGNWWAWRREASPMHDDMINHMETQGLAQFNNRAGIQKVTAKSFEEAKKIMGNR